MDLGFLIATPILVVVDSIHGYLQLHHALLLTSLSQFSLLVVTSRIDIFSLFAVAKACATCFTSLLDAMEIVGITFESGPHGSIEG